MNIQKLAEEGARLEHELRLLQEQLQGNEWFEILCRNVEGAQRRHNAGLQEQIQHAKAVIAEREEATFQENFRKNMQEYMKDSK